MDMAKSTKTIRETNHISIDEVNDIVIVTRWLEPGKLGEFLRIFYKSLK